MIEEHRNDYDAGSIEKAERLIDLLSEIDRHPLLSKKVCLHGGTAINLFMLKAPRLSTDADITYIGNAEKSAADDERPQIENAIQDVGTFLGYNVTAAKGEIAGRTFRLRYRGSRGSDYVKIDINYLNRVALLPPIRSKCALDSNVLVTTLSREELIAGQTKALFDRVTVRDLYDISHLYSIMRELFDFALEGEKMKLHRTIMFYAALSNLFPTKFSGLTEKRFVGRGKQVSDELYPVLRADDKPTLDEMIRNAEAFVSEYVEPQDEAGKEYLKEFGAARFRPELLFKDWPEILAAAEISPSAKWKLLNLAKRPIADLA
ncbi:MAG: nucleotidyl transferase AbiEii/AbiGii toxin family protein [Clostridiales Family XIII bacterium]|jgi:predicted nucleotidyltransferase component of viral defense system|nr:nucleotidyl transferase AbiEii/AbiGii toxin family protein [Clostridiales Family XIII bacterium]